MYPVQRSVRKVTGAAALLDDEAADKLLLDSRTPQEVRRATTTHYKSCVVAWAGERQRSP